MGWVPGESGPGPRPRMAPLTIASAAKCNYLWLEGDPIEDSLHERLAGPAEAVAPDGGRTCDVHDRVSSTRIHSRRTTLSHGRRVLSRKQWTSHSSRTVVATWYSPRPGTGTKSTVSMSRVPVRTGNSARQKADASIYVATTTSSNEAAFPDLMPGFPLHRGGE
jgi:hypothetical protein